MIMSIKESYLGIAIFLIVVPALILLSPGAVTYTVIGAVTALYLGTVFVRPERRCVKCGEVVKLGPVGYINLRMKRLKCPHCATLIKNSHRL